MVYVYLVGLPPRQTAIVQITDDDVVIDRWQLRLRLRRTYSSLPEMVIKSVGEAKTRTLRHGDFSSLGVALGDLVWR